MNFKLSFVIAALTALFSFSASANKPEGNIILKFNPATRTVEKLVTKQKITSAAQAQHLAKTGKFTPLTKANIASSGREIDQESGTSSWYVNSPWLWNNNWNTWGGSTTTIWWSGQTMQPFYNWGWNNCNYLYYGNRGWNGGGGGWNGGWGW